jgi:hypothetical protein
MICFPAVTKVGRCNQPQLVPLLSSVCRCLQLRTSIYGSKIDSQCFLSILFLHYFSLRCARPAAFALTSIETRRIRMKKHHTFATTSMSAASTCRTDLADISSKIKCTWRNLLLWEDRRDRRRSYLYQAPVKQERYTLIRHWHLSMS